MEDLHNTIKSLRATVARFQKDHAEIYGLLAAKGIRCKNLASGFRRYLKRINNAKKLLK